MSNFTSKEHSRRKVQGLRSGICGTPKNIGDCTEPSQAGQVQSDCNLCRTLQSKDVLQRLGVRRYPMFVVTSGGGSKSAVWFPAFPVSNVLSSGVCLCPMLPAAEAWRVAACASVVHLCRLTLPLKLVMSSCRWLADLLSTWLRVLARRQATLYLPSSWNLVSHLGDLCKRKRDGQHMLSSMNATLCCHGWVLQPSPLNPVALGRWENPNDLMALIVRRPKYNLCTGP